MQYLKDHYTVNWDAVHKAHNDRVKELRTAFRTIVIQDITISGVKPCIQ